MYIQLHVYTSSTATTQDIIGEKTQGDIPPAVLTYGHTQVVEEEVDLEKERKSWKQVEKSALRLDKLTTDGSELVSNVAVAEDAREVQCRQEQEESRNARSAGTPSLYSYTTHE